MHVYSFVIILCSYLLVCRGRSCNFPTALTKHLRHGHWRWKLSYDDHNKYQNKSDIVTFHGHQMVVKRSVKGHGDRLHKIVFSRSCVERVFKNTYIVTHEVSDKPSNYLCMEFVFRSKSLLQIRTSELYKTFDSAMCNRNKLRLNQWPLVLQSSMHNEFKVCSFTGGYDLTIGDWRGIENGCNMMDVPMRMESECLKGEGITFNFRYTTCVDSLPINALQKTYCVADWTDGTYLYSVLRKQVKFNSELWCLQTPVKHGNQFEAKLYFDFSCGNSLNETVKVLTFPLKKTIPKPICSDENPKCDSLRCGVYTQQQCLNTCDVCSPAGTGACTFPQDMQGGWFQRTFDHYSRISITRSEINIHSVGRFTCLAPPATLDKQLRKFALLSTFDNGCRARYSCIAVRNYDSPSVLAYSLGQSFTWPYGGDQSAELACKNENFKTDPPPVKGRFRTKLDTPKTTISQAYSLTGVKCGNIDAYRIQGVFYTNETCSGRFYRDCKDSSRLRFEYVGCRTQPLSSDYVCLASYKGRYWETIITIQNLRDQKDARCIVFSTVRKDEMLLLAASDCDSLAWEYVSSGQRTAIGTLQFRKLAYKCKNIPTVVPSTSERPRLTPAMVLVSRNLADGPNYDTTLRPVQPKLSYEIDANIQRTRNINLNRQGTKDRNTASERKETSVLNKGRNASPRSLSAWVQISLLMVAVALSFQSNR